jgi:hypothetical protein
MNGCYSLFSVAVMTAACASASRQTPVRVGEASPPGRAPEANAGAHTAAPVARAGLVPEDPDEKAIRELRQAAELFETFIAKAGTDPKYADAVQRSRDRVDDIQREIEFLSEGIKERRSPAP